MLDHFNKVSLNKLVDNLLCNSKFNVIYSNSDVLRTLLATYASSGSCIENSKRISDQISENSQGGSIKHLIYV